REGRGRGIEAVLALAVVCLAAPPADAGVWTQLGTLPVPLLTAVCRTDHGSIVVASSPPSDTSEVWEYDGLSLVRLASPYVPRPVFGSIHAVAAAPNGDIWVGSDLGAFRLTKAGFTKYTKTDGLGSRLVDRVNALVVATDGTVWAGTEGGGL